MLGANLKVASRWKRWSIYTGSIGGGVRKSTDNGVTWSAVNDGLAPRAIYSLAVDAAGPEIVYAGAFSPNAAEPSGVYKSSDGGASWTLQPGAWEFRSVPWRTRTSQPRTKILGLLALIGIST